MRRPTRAAALDAGSETMGGIRYALFAVALAAATAALPVVWRRRRRQPVAVDSLLVLLVGVITWSSADFLAYDLGVSGVLLALVAGVIYVAIGTTVGSFFVLAISMAGTGWRPSRRALVLLAIDPVVAGLLAATNSWHGLFFTGAGSRVPETYVNWQPGPLMWIHLGWVYSAFAVSLAVLVLGTWQRPAVYRRHNLLLALAPAPPLALNLLILRGYSEQLAQYGADRTSLGLVASTVIVSIAVLRSDLVVVPAVARALLVEQLADALMVLNVDGRVLDLNSAGRRLARAAQGRDDLDIGDWVRGDVDMLGSAPDVPLAVVIEGQVRHFAVQRHPLSNGRGDTLGTIVQATDVTQAHAARLELLERMSEVQSLQRRLSYEAEHDALTGLPNRRSLDRGVSRAAADGRTYAVALADIDRFKSVNDRYGHPVGDAVLQHAAAVLSQVAADHGLLGRWGGEEFVLLVEGGRAERAPDVAELLRTAAASHPAEVEGVVIPWSVSIGVAIARGGVPAVQTVAAADRALYVAKSCGRDRVVIASDDLTGSGSGAVGVGGPGT